MKIIYASLTDPDASGGIGAHMHGMARALGEKGHNVTIVCPGNASYNESFDGFSVHRIEMRNRSFRGRLKYDRELARIVERNTPDLTIYRLTTSLIVSPLLALIRGQRRIVEVNGPTWHELNSESRNRLAVFMSKMAIQIQIRCAQGFVAVTPLLCKHVSQYAPAIELPNGTDIKSVPNWKPIDQPITMVFTGAFTQWYDIDLVLDSISLLESDLGRKFQLMLVGDGPRLAEIKARVFADPFLGERVEFHEWMKRTEALKLVARAHVGLIPLRPKKNSTELGSPLKLFDYVAVGIPTVITRLDGCESTNSTLISYFDHSNIDGFVHAVKSSLKNGGLTKEQLNDLRSEISWSNRANQLLQFVDALYYKKRR